MSSSVSISIATNTVIAAAKGFGWAVTGSPTLFAETIHSVADVLNQVLLKVGEVRGRRGPDAAHPFGMGQEKFFWALVSAVSVFFIGCGLNIYHGVHALISPSVIEPFTPLVLGSAAVRAGARIVHASASHCARSAAGRASPATATTPPFWPCCSRMRWRCSGILLTLMVAGVSLSVGIASGVRRGGGDQCGRAAGRDGDFLAAINRRLLIDSSDPAARSRRRTLPRREGLAGEGELDPGRRRSRRAVRPRAASPGTRTSSSNLMRWRGVEGTCIRRTKGKPSTPCTGSFRCRRTDFRSPSERSRQAKHVFGNVGKNHVGRHRRDLIEPSLAKLAFRRRTRRRSRSLRASGGRRWPPPRTLSPPASLAMFASAPQGLPASKSRRRVKTHQVRGLDLDVALRRSGTARPGSCRSAGRTPRARSHSAARDRRTSIRRRCTRRRSACVRR